LPQLIEQLTPLVDSGRLSVVMVNLDRPELIDDMQVLIRKHRIDFPVIYNGDAGGFHQPIGDEWGIRGAPSACLVDPQGVIYAKATGRNVPRLWELAASLTAAADVPPPIGLSTSWVIHSDEQVELLISLSSPHRLPLEVELDYQLPLFTFSEDGETMLSADRTRFDGPEDAFTVEFPDTCEKLVRVFIDTAGYSGVEYTVRVKLPEVWQGADDAGIWTNSSGWVYFDEQVAEYSMLRF
jgi:hypothetical protein